MTDNPKAGADVGKFVNLMAVDANRIAMFPASGHSVYESESSRVCIWVVFLNYQGLCRYHVVASILLYQYVLPIIVLHTYQSLPSY